MKPSYVAIWIWLIVLLFVSVSAVYLPFSHALTTFFIFLVAVAKACLIAVYFMHLKDESNVIRAIGVVPIIFFVIMTLALIPDIVAK